MNNNKSVVEGPDSVEDSLPGEAGIEELIEELRNLLASGRVLSSASELESVEKEIRQQVGRIHNVALQALLQRWIDSKASRLASLELIRQLPFRMRSAGRQSVRVKSASGGLLELSVPYWRRKSGRRRRREKGMFPALVLLGILERCTPLLASEVGVLGAVAGSFQEAANLLEDRGIELGTKAIQKLAGQLALRVRTVQSTGHLPTCEDLVGRRVVVSCDGGRLRTRSYKRGPRTKKNRRRFHTPWREPTLLIVYCVCADGKVDRTFAPIIDGTLQGVDVLFALVRYYLRNLKIQAADRILWIADGARWIWNRIAELSKDFGFASGRVLELIDFYHAAQRLAKVAALPKRWSEKQRKRWFVRQRRDLRRGEAHSVIGAIKKLCRGRGSTKIKEHLNYFETNKERLDYASALSAHLPIGSGAIESAIRRVVNLRLKSPGTFWLPSNAEAILLLRAYFKAGRWNLLKTMAFSSQGAVTT